MLDVLFGDQLEVMHTQHTASRSLGAVTQIEQRFDLKSRGDTSIMIGESLATNKPKSIEGISNRKVGYRWRRGLLDNLREFFFLGGVLNELIATLREDYRLS
jgi:hypothetical protein